MATNISLFFFLCSFAVCTKQQNRPDKQMSNFSEMFLLLCTDTYPKKKQRNKIENKEEDK